MGLSGYMVQVFGARQTLEGPCSVLCNFICLTVFCIIYLPPCIAGGELLEKMTQLGCTYRNVYILFISLDGGSTYHYIAQETYNYATL